MKSNSKLFSACTTTFHYRNEYQTALSYGTTDMYVCKSTGQ